MATEETPASAKVSANVDDKGSNLVIEARGLKPKPPVFFSVEATGHARLADGAKQTLDQEFTLKVKIVQGTPESLTLSLNGDGELAEVTGDRVAGWAVRVEAETQKRFLEIRLTPAAPPAVANPILNF